MSEPSKITVDYGSTITVQAVQGCVNLEADNYSADEVEAIQLKPGEARALAHILTVHATAAGGSEAQQPAPVLTVDLLGRAAYLAYRTATDGRSAITGDVLPPWDQLMPELREAWRAVGDGVQMVISVGRSPA